MGKYTETFTSGDLTSGVLTVTHSLGQKISDCIVVDSSSNVICPDVSYTDDDELTVDLSETGITSGTVVVMSDEGCLTADKTVNLDNSMSASEIQAEIDAQPKNLNGYTLTFQFADGTYTLSTTLDFDKFYNGTLNIYGNSSDNSLSTSKAVFLDFSGGNCGGLSIISNCSLYVRFLKIAIDTSTSNLACVYVENVIMGNIAYNYTYGTSTAYGYGISAHFSTVLASYNYVSNISVGINSMAGILTSNINDDTGTLPKWGLRVSWAGVIGKYGTQPSGSTANELVECGGEIR